MIARARHYARAAVTFTRIDAYTMPGHGKTFDAGFAAFWLSHVDAGRRRDFLDAFHARLQSGSPVLMFDERSTAGRGLRTSRTDATGNRYEMRSLLNGERFEIIKNFYSGEQLEELFSRYGHECSYEELENFWVFSYRVT